MRTQTPDLLLPDGGRYYGPVLTAWPRALAASKWSTTRWYVGQMHQGRMHGQGRLDSAGGEFKDGMLNGKGTQHSVTGMRYTGQFQTAALKAKAS